MDALRSGKYCFQSGILILGCFLWILFSSFTSQKNIQKSDRSDDSNLKVNSPEPTAAASISLPYFPKIYSGFGIDHMNVNLVSLRLTGLIRGDEIGVFDGKYCVGALVISEKHISENSISIPSSANDSLVASPNGYIQGHKITMKVYRDGKVYLLYFQTVNNSRDIFEKGGSMFAMVDFSRSTGQISGEENEKIKIYPNPFTDYLKIEINISHRKELNVAIFDLNGKLIITLFEGIAEGPILTNWDGKDRYQRQVPSGIYFCRVNQTIYGIIYQGIGID